MSGAGAGRPFGLNAGTFADSSHDTLMADIAKAVAEIGPAMARQAEYQSQAASFMAATGEAANDGHRVGFGIVMDIEPPNPE